MKSPLNSSAEPGDVLQRVAAVLLQQAEIETARRPNLSLGEMAARLDASWDMVNSSLKSLQAQGAIRIDRHRMHLNRKALERIAVVRGF